MRELNGKPAIVRTERGLTISGTRISLYDLMDYLRDGYPVKFIRGIFSLTEAQINAALAYIEENRQEIEAEYELVLQEAAESYQYWQERNREHFARIDRDYSRDREAIRAKLKAQKSRNFEKHKHDFSH